MQDVAGQGSGSRCGSSSPGEPAPDRAATTRFPAATHEVTHQPSALAGYNLHDSDAALQEAIRREGAAWAEESLRAFGARVGTAEYLRLGARPNRHPPELDTPDRVGHRIDQVRFHPTCHALARVAIEAGLHVSD